jgi:hypothetical protein
MHVEHTNKLNIKTSSRSVEDIQTYITGIIGLPMTSVSRVVDMQCLHFGSFESLDNDGKPKQVGEYSIHLQCAWRLTHEDAIYTGLDDLFEPIDDKIDKYDPDFDCLKQDVNVLDKKLKELLEKYSMVVQDIILDSFGGAEIVLDQGFRLSIFPTVSQTHEQAEHWRILNRKTQQHLVSEIAGLNLS